MPHICNSEIFERMNHCQIKMVIILNEVYNKIFKLSFLYCNGIFLWNPYFHFAEPRVSAEHHLGNTVLDQIQQLSELKVNLYRGQS
jgi:hypothetical protein